MRGRASGSDRGNSSHYEVVIFGCNARYASHVLFMKQSDLLRENADNCLQLAERAEGEPAFKRYLRMAQAWTALAHEQDWLDGEVSPLTIKAA
jgi:hypothetical protein